MAKERLSELQYYILGKLCEAEGNYIDRSEVYEFFKGSVGTESNRVVVSRSLKRLREKGLIECQMKYRSSKIELRKDS